MEIDIFLHIIHPWDENKDFARVMVSHTRNSAIRRRTDDSIIHSLQAREEATPRIRAKSTSEDCKVGTGDWLAQTYELSKDFVYIGELSDSPDSSVYVPSTIESGEDDLNYGALVDRADQRDQLSQTSLLITTKTWAYGPEQSWQGHWQYYGWEHSQDLWDLSEYHNWRWLPWYKRFIHQRQMDTADNTSQHHDAHHTYSKAICQSFLRL